MIISVDHTARIPAKYRHNKAPGLFMLGVVLYYCSLFFIGFSLGALFLFYSPLCVCIYLRIYALLQTSSRFTFAERYYCYPCKIPAHVSSSVTRLFIVNIPVNEILYDVVHFIDSVIVSIFRISTSFSRKLSFIKTTHILSKCVEEQHDS